MRHALFSWLAAAGMALAAEPVTPVALTVSGELDPSLVARVRDWASEQLALPVPMVPSAPLEAEPSSLEAVAEAMAPAVPERAIGLVVLYNGQRALPHHGIYRPDLRVVVVNVPIMREGADEEILARRLERQLIRGICMLMGLEFSPNPQSAMAAYTTMEELDEMARNLDPPWLIMVQERAMELGIPLDPESPYNMFRENLEE